MSKLRERLAKLLGERFKNSSDRIKAMDAFLRLNTVREQKEFVEAAERNVFAPSAPTVQERYTKEALRHSKSVEESLAAQMEFDALSDEDKLTLVEGFEKINHVYHCDVCGGLTTQGRAACETFPDDVKDCTCDAPTVGDHCDVCGGLTAQGREAMGPGSDLRICLCAPKMTTADALQVIRVALECSRHRDGARPLECLEHIGRLDAIQGALEAEGTTGAQ